MATMTDDTTFTCSDCKAVKLSKAWPDDCTFAYGKDNEGNKVCIECCGVRDKADMIETGKATLYLTMDKDGSNFITNWPGTLKIVLPSGAIRKGRHNIARTRYDVWFYGPDQKPWHGVQYGENTQIIHCKRIKKF